MSIAVEILNSIRENADTLYKERVPVATQDNIAQIGRILDEYDVQYNHFIHELMHKIGLTLVQTDLFTNKLAKFKSGKIMTGQDVEDIFVEAYREAESSYDPYGGVGSMDGEVPAGIHPFKRRDYQATHIKYYRMNRQDMYTITLLKDDVIRAFTSEAKLSQFIAAQFNSMYTGASYDEWIHMKELLAEGIKDGAFKTYLVPEIKEDSSVATAQKACQAMVRTVKKAIADVSYPDTQFNKAGVKTHTSKENLVLFVHKDIQPHLDVDLYSLIFGPDYAKLGIEIVELDNFGSDNNGTYALLCDKDIFKVYDVKNYLGQMTNEQGMYTNFFYHVWQILAFSNFKTAVRFGTKDITEVSA